LIYIVDRTRYIVGDVLLFYANEESKLDKKWIRQFVEIFNNMLEIKVITKRSLHSNTVNIQLISN